MSLLCIICPRCGGTAFLPKDEFPGDLVAIMTYHVEHPMSMPSHWPAASEGLEYVLCDPPERRKCPGSGEFGWLGIFKPKK